MRNNMKRAARLAVVGVTVGTLLAAGQVSIAQDGEADPLPGVSTCNGVPSPTAGPNCGSNPNCVTMLPTDCDATISGL